jgi:hypothetical protein
MMHSVQSFLVENGGCLVITVAAGSVCATLAAFGVFVYSHVIGEGQGAAEGHGHADAHHEH